MADYEFDSAAEWQTGDFVNCHAVDPAGKLTPGVAPETLVELLADNNLAIYLRCREGIGTTVDNIATAGEDGTLSNADAWQTRADGRHYLTGRSITVPYFADMKVVDDNDHSWSYAAQMRVRFSEFSAQVLLQRATRFKLGIDATGHPYFQNYYHISEIDNEEHVLDVEQNEWWYLGHTNIAVATFVMTGHSGAAYELDATNGKVKFTGAAFDGTVEVDYYHHEATGWTAEADCKDDDALSLNEWHELGIVCSNGYLSLYLDGDIVATLETYYSDNDPETDLVAACTGDWSDVAYAGEDESACLVRFPTQGSWSKEIEIGTDKTIRYLELDTSFVTLEHSIQITVAFADSAAELDYARRWSWSVQETDSTTYFPPELGLLHGTWIKVTVSVSEDSYDRDAVLVDALRIWVRTPATILYDYERSPRPGILVPEFGIPENLEQLIANVRALYVVTNELSREISEVRISAEQGIPGIPGPPGEPGVPGVSDETDWAAEINRILEQHTQEFWFWLPVFKKDHEHVGYLMQKTNFLDARRAVHWERIMENMRDIITAGTDLTTHAALDTGVHGAGEDVLATNDDIATHAGDPSAHHVKYTDGAVELVITAELVNGQSIDNRIDSLIGTHEGSATAHGSVENNFATHAAAVNPHSDSLNVSHAGVTTAVHGAGAGDHIAISIQSGDTVEDLIGDHNTAVTVHANQDWVTDTALGIAVENHRLDTTWVHGIEDTADLCTEPC